MQHISFAVSLLFDQGQAADTTGRLCDHTFPFESIEVLHSGTRGQMPFGWFLYFWFESYIDPLLTSKPHQVSGVK